MYISESINADSPSILLHHFLSFRRQLCPFIPYLQASRSRTGRPLTLGLLPYSIFTMPQTNDSIETTKGSATGDAMYRLLCIYQIETTLLTIFIRQVDERPFLFSHFLQRPYLGGVSTQALYIWYYSCCRSLPLEPQCYRRWEGNNPCCGGDDGGNIARLRNHLRQSCRSSTL